jgi:hypothetical protein
MRFFPLGIIGAGMLAFFPNLHGENPVKNDGFLDQPLPVGLPLATEWDNGPDGKSLGVKYSVLRMGSVEQEVQLLSSLVGKRIALPAYIAAELKTDNDPGQKGYWGLEKNQEVRPIFNRVCFSLGMVWRYEPLRDDIALDMKWRRDDPRTREKLVGILNQTAPVDWDKLPWGSANILGGKDHALDPWRVAFDSLLSKPENISTAGQVRIFHDRHVELMPGPFPVMNLLSKKMRDVSGRAETLVLNTQIQMSNKQSPSRVAYYLFDQDGKFIKGGVYAMGEDAEGMIVKAKADSDNAVTIDIGCGSFAMNPYHAHFALVNGDLILQGATDSKGSVLSASETRTPGQPPRWHGAIGVLKFSVAGAGPA